MKYISIFIIGTLFFSAFMHIEKIRKMELLILELYTNSFKEYVYIDANYNIQYDKEHLKKYLEKEGYSITYKEADLCFDLSFKDVFYYKNNYCFYLVKNDEFK